MAVPSGAVKAKVITTQLPLLVSWLTLVPLMAWASFLLAAETSVALLTV